MVIELDGQMMTDRAQTHAYLKNTFRFPEYYGNNLDALYDLLTEFSEPSRIVLKNKDIMLKHLGAYGTALLVTLHQAEENTSAISIEVYG